MDLNIYQYGYEKCQPLHSYGPFIRNNYLFHYVLSGRGTLRVENADYSCSEYKIGANSGFLIEPGQITTYFADRSAPWEYCWIEFAGLRAREILESAGLSASNPVFFPQSEEYAEKVGQEMLYLTSHSHESSLHLMGHVYLVMDALVQGSSRKRKIQDGKLSKFYTREAVAFIEQNYAQPITVEDMAARCNLERSYFGKIFKETMGQSPQSFLIRYRMSKAAQLLTTTDFSICDVGVQTGYPNQLHFSRAFKNVYGISPREYRQKNKLV
ncbi:AraC family transcriptional regulator [Ruminococcus sp. 5_1_39BFAA]|uniref:AraC family transcriptional regulator n=1 Tax=Ruminococcus sp. 5_1_39BFAA TaxID=457412 RepID=UPI003565F6BD